MLISTDASSKTCGYRSIGKFWPNLEISEACFLWVSKFGFSGDLGILCLGLEFWNQGLAVSYPTPNKKQKNRGGGTSLQEADGDVPLDVVAFSPLDWLFQWSY